MGIEIDANKLIKLRERYGVELVDKAMMLMAEYVDQIASEAQEIVEKEAADTRDLKRAIRSSVKLYVNKFVGKVYTTNTAEHAAAIHEGAKHPAGGGDPQPYFVPFSEAESLLKWAKKHKKIVQRTRKKKKRWYFVSKDGKTLRSLGSTMEQVRKKGMLVHHKPRKYFERPILESKDEFAQKLSDLVKEV